MMNTTDIFATLASVVGSKLPDDAAVDSFDMLPAMLGIQDEKDSIRPHMLTQSFRSEFQIRQGDWKYLNHRGSGLVPRRHLCLLNRPSRDGGRRHSGGRRSR